MKLIIFGPPGSGKGTYSQRLETKIGIKKISTGDFFRAEVKNQTPLGKKIISYLNKGQLVPDEVVIDVIKKILEKVGKDNFILDGFPRTIPQAKFLIDYIKIDALINILVHDEILIGKISARRICSNPNCDGNYNLADIRKKIDEVEYILPPLLPKDDMKCDKCGSELIQRSDDRPEIIKERLKVYYKQTQPVYEFLKNSGIKTIDVWMNRPPDEIVDRIIKKLEEKGILKH